MIDGWHDGMGAGGWVLMTFVWFALIAAVVWVAARLFQRDEGSTRDAAQRERAGDVLDRRLAAGDIDEQTYDRLRAKLRDARATQG